MEKGPGQQVFKSSGSAATSALRQVSNQTGQDKSGQLARAMLVACLRGVWAWRIKQQTGSGTYSEQRAASGGRGKPSRRVNQRQVSGAGVVDIAGGRQRGALCDLYTTTTVAEA
jgi:hypothetical protein